MKFALLITFFLFQFFSAFGQQPIKKACETEGFRKFDFWIGDWNVYSQDKLVGTNFVQAILDSCIIEENWVGNGGVNGKSFNSYNPITDEWSQIWVDSQASVINFKGKFEGKVLVLYGKRKDAKNKNVFDQLSFEPQQDGSILQIWKTSTNNKEWKTIFHGHYKRKN